MSMHGWTLFASILGLALASTLAAADEEDPRCTGEHSLWHPLPDACLGLIDTDRPHQTDTPHVVPAGHAQFESAPAELQLGGTVGTTGGNRDARLVFFDDNY